MVQCRRVGERKSNGPGGNPCEDTVVVFGFLGGVGTWDVYEWIATLWKAVDALYPKRWWVEVWWTPVFRPDVMSVRFLRLPARPKGRVLKNAGISLARSVV